MQPHGEISARRLATFASTKRNSMLHSITWQQYLTAVTLITAAWYAYVGLHFYQPKPKRTSVTPAVAGPMTAVMGSIRPDEATGLHDELVFGTPSPDEISDRTLPKGPADDLLGEASVLVDAYSDNHDKAGFLSLFSLLISKYEVFADEISLPVIIRSLDTSKLPFQIQANEWPLSFAS